MDPAVSRDAEVLIFDPRPDDLPSFVAYLAAGGVQVHFALGFGYGPSGAQPDVLRPALEAAAVIPPEDSIGDMLRADEEVPKSEQHRRVLKVVGEYFGLSLPHQTIVSGRLPTAVTRRHPPASW
ncbi:hypothetical protein [Streptomyces sp. NPDC056982]|uniref:hypothetical protein n=1 Tax=Streptomyces sp. NPDC056982 TaxID=3345986 RepID=UPI00364496E3